MGADERALYGRLLLYLVGLNVLLVAAVATLHELGHAIIATLAGCTDATIVLFDTAIRSTYAQLQCPAQPGEAVFLLSSFTFLLPLAILFWLLGWFKERYIGHIILGMSIAFAALDLQLLIDAVGVQLVVALIGLVIALYGEDRLVHGIIVTEGRHPQRGQPN